MPRPLHACDCRAHQRELRVDRKRSQVRFIEARLEGLCGTCRKNRPSQNRRTCEICIQKRLNRLRSCPTITRTQTQQRKRRRAS